MPGSSQTLEDFDDAIRDVSDFITDLDRERDADGTLARNTGRSPF